MARFTREQWLDAALEAMAEGGTVAINMEQLARSMGGTKGAVYYHFENRRALLGAALARWEQAVEDDIAAGDELPDPRDRLSAITLVAAGTKLDGFVDVALASSMDDPEVAATVRRVNTRRLNYVVGILCELGVPESVREERALGGLAAYLGLYQLQRSTDRRFDEGMIRRLLGGIVDSMVRPWAS